MKFRINENGKVHEFSVIAEGSGEDFTKDYVENMIREYGFAGDPLDETHDYVISGSNFEFLIETAIADARANDELGINTFAVITDY